eukprot:TRINITY_DN18808_c1_g1_i1.p1 TRINITY_DN18808_c1_g1~~TRINITY_DN18808_c1_g1_i1.p1  ORF type:complete len:532 (-),score=77.10 TRINITY_DN18808_c1_g1_i1:107-1537(-)
METWPSHWVQSVANGIDTADPNSWQQHAQLLEFSVALPPSTPEASQPGGTWANDCANGVPPLPGGSPWGSVGLEGWPGQTTWAYPEFGMPSGSAAFDTFAPAKLSEGGLSWHESASDIQSSKINDNEPCKVSLGLSNPSPQRDEGCSSACLDSADATAGGDTHTGEPFASLSPLPMFGEPARVPVSASACASPERPRLLKLSDALAECTSDEVQPSPLILRLSDVLGPETGAAVDRPGDGPSTPKTTPHDGGALLLALLQGKTVVDAEAASPTPAGQRVIADTSATVAATVSAASTALACGADVTSNVASDGDERGVARLPEEAIPIPCPSASGPTATPPRTPRRRGGRSRAGAQTQQARGLATPPGLETPPATPPVKEGSSTPSRLLASPGLATPPGLAEPSVPPALPLFGRRSSGGSSSADPSEQASQVRDAAKVSVSSSGTSAAAPSPTTPPLGRRARNGERRSVILRPPQSR